MGRIQAQPSPSQPSQPQIETDQYDLQPQEYQYESVVHEEEGSTHEGVPLSNYETSYTNQNQEGQLQEQLQPPPEQQQPAQYPPQNPQSTPNSAYQTRSVQSPQMNQMYANQPAVYPPQRQQQMPPQTPQTSYTPKATVQTYPPQAASASPQAYPPQPVQFPPQNGAAPQSFPPQQVQYPPQNGATVPQPAFSPQPVQFPPQNGAAPQAFPPQQVQFPTQNGAQGYMAMPPSPYKPAAQVNVAAQGIPMHMNPVPQPVGTEGWRTGLFDCMNDPMNALITAFFPCLTFGQVAEIVDNGHTTCGTSGLLYGVIAFFIGVPCIMSCTYRTKLRNKYGLIEAPAPDWVTHFFCEWCALCQEYRELQLRGLDPSIGWHGNVARNQGMQQGAMVPPMNQTMMG